MRIRALAVLAVLALGVAACSNEDSGGGGTNVDAGSRPGVTDTEIQVGSLISKSNPVGLPYANALVGAQAYFDRVNADGGIYDREIVIAADRDDQSSPNGNVTENRALVEEDKVFAIVPEVVQFFAGAEYLAQQGTPTFGWLIHQEFDSGPNLFGQNGSYLCFECPGGPATTAALELGAERAAVFAYGGIPQSEDCADAAIRGFEVADIDVVVADTSLSFGFTDTSAAVAAVRDANADFLLTCMDLNGTATLAGDIKDAGVDLDVLSPQGNDPEAIQALGSDVEGMYIYSFATPFGVDDPPPGLQEFMDAVEEAGQEPNELALVGWLNAALFVEGLERAGEDFTQESVVEAINSITEPYTADGILAPNVVWGITDDYPEGRHGPALNGLACSAFVQVQDGELVPALGKPGKPFVCFEGYNEVDAIGVPEENFDDPIYEPQ
jgi:branched-chain amino acid transport system substrate-binding protein